MDFLILIGWFVFCAAVANYSKTKGQNAILWFVLSIAFSPLVGLFLLFMEDEKDIVKMAPRVQVMSKNCPFCAETIKWEAVVCRFCGKDQPQAVPRVASVQARAFNSPEPKILTPRIVGAPTTIRVAKDGQELGAFTYHEVDLLIKNSELSLNDYYLDQSSNAWVTLRDNPDLAD